MQCDNILFERFRKKSFQAILGVWRIDGLIYSDVMKEIKKKKEILEIRRIWNESRDVYAEQPLNTSHELS